MRERGPEAIAGTTIAGRHGTLDEPARTGKAGIPARRQAALSEECREQADDRSVDRARWGRPLRKAAAGQAVPPAKVVVA